MSNVIPPMLSSTPPPMDDDNLDSDEEDDDEFGDFSTADLNYGMDMSQPSKPPINTLWMENGNHLPSSPRDSINFKSDTSQHNGKQLILELQDSNTDAIEESDTSVLSGELQQDGISQDSVVSMVTDSGLCSVSQNSVETTSPVQLEHRRSPVSPIDSQQDSNSSDETVVKSSSIDPDRTLPSVASIHEETTVVLDDRISDNLDLTSSQVDFENDFKPFRQAVEDITDCDDRFSETKPVAQQPDSPINDFTDFHSNFTEFQSECNTSDTKHLSNFQCDNAFSTVSPTLNSDIHRPMSPGLDKNRISSDDRQEDTVTIDSLASSDDIAKQMPPDPDFSDSSGFTLCEESDLGLVLEEIDDDLSSVDNDKWQSSVSRDTRESATLETTHSDSEFDDFTAFDSCGVTDSLTDIPPKQYKEDEDDEFSDFSSSAFTSTKDSTSFFPASQSDDSGWANESTLQLPSVSAVNDNVDDDFDDDFDDFETASIPIVNNDQLSARFATVVTSLFPGQSDEDRGVGCQVTVTSQQGIVDASAVWRHLQDVDTSNALSYQWNSSATNKMLLTSLGIDARNILFGPKWNVSVPRFAANLGISPLEPMRASSPPPLVPTREPPPLQPQPSTQAVNTSTRSEVAVPDAQFDWTSSGLVNPLDCVEKNGKRAASQEHATINDGQRLLNAAATAHTGLSVEAAKVLASLPDLSFLRAKSLVFPQQNQSQR